jgi:hypothetical protein
VVRDAHGDSSSVRTGSTARVAPSLSVTVVVAVVVIVIGTGLFIFSGHASDIYGVGGCYYDGRYRDCETVPVGPAADTANVYRAVIDSLYFGGRSVTPAGRE